jgi:hypothetical protein
VAKAHHDKTIKDESRNMENLLFAGAHYRTKSFSTKLSSNLYGNA